MAKNLSVRGGGKSRSLRGSLLLLIFLCWVVPVLLTTTLTGFLQTHNNRRHVSGLVTTTTQNAMANVRKDLDATVMQALSVSYIPTIRNAYMQYQKDFAADALYDASRNFLQQQFSRNDMISTMHIVFPEVPVIAKRCYTYNPFTSSFAQAQQFYSSTAYEESLALLPTLDTDIAFIQAQNQLFLVRLLSLQGNRFKPYAVLVTEINLKSLYAGLHNLHWLTDITLYINDIPLLVNGANILQQSTASPPSTSPKTDLHKNILSISGHQNSGRFRLQYAARADLRPLMSEMGGSLILVLALSLFSIPLMGFVLSFFMRRVNAPIRSLSGLAGEIEGGKFGAQIQAETLGSTEFITLGTQLNAMSARLRNQFEQLYREELALRDARIKALQSQINPHFLGNTLEIINWEARLAGNVKVSMMMEALSTMLEATLDRRRRPLIHLSEEMMYINAYLYIIRERLGKRLEIRLEIDEILQDWYVPRLILQPIVENAVEHGVTARQRGVITIRVLPVNEDWMRLEVENDAPISPESEQRIQALLSSEQEDENDTSGNIGIRNVHLRLRILYGAESGLCIYNNAQNHTISSMLVHRHNPACSPGAN